MRRERVKMVKTRWGFDGIRLRTILEFQLFRHSLISHQLLSLLSHTNLLKGSNIHEDSNIAESWRALVISKSVEDLSGMEMEMSYSFWEVLRGWKIFYDSLNLRNLKKIEF